MICPVDTDSPGELHAQGVDEPLLHPAQSDLRNVVVTAPTIHSASSASRTSSQLPSRALLLTRVPSDSRSTATVPAATGWRGIPRCATSPRPPLPPRCPRSTSGTGAPCNVVPLVTFRTSPVSQSTSATSPSSKASRIPGHGRDGQPDVDAVAQAQAVERVGDDAAHAETHEDVPDGARRADAEVAAGEQDVAGLHLVHPSRPVG